MTLVARSAPRCSDRCMSDKDPLVSQLQFVLEVQQVKRLSGRSGGPRAENSAGKSWHLALMALVLSEYAPRKTDLSKVIAMLVVHGLAQIDAGHLDSYGDEATQQSQAREERLEAGRLLSWLPPEQEATLDALQAEFEKRVTREARFAWALDRLQLLLTDYSSGESTWRDNDITADHLRAQLSLINDGSPALGELAAELVDGAELRGLLAQPPASD